MDKKIFLKEDGPIMLFPYAKDLYYHPRGSLSMTLELFNNQASQEFSFAIDIGAGPLRDFLDQIIEGEYYLNEED